eukprot:GDKH01025327.1.p1 GENE.GDKH01025327.1~~GDKH01025327.1.p1  ORF type:complete len:188 (+),score=14.69 GDKH01025327.1:122-685(+)
MESSQPTNEWRNLLTRFRISAGLAVVLWILTFRPNLICALWLAVPIMGIVCVKDQTNESSRFLSVYFLLFAFLLLWDCFWASMGALAFNVNYVLASVFFIVVDFANVYYAKKLSNQVTSPGHLNGEVVSVEYQAMPRDHEHSLSPGAPHPGYTDASAPGCNPSYPTASSSQALHGYPAQNHGAYPPV